jgi:hypothetical protein
MSGLLKPRTPGGTTNHAPEVQLSAGRALALPAALAVALAALGLLHRRQDPAVLWTFLGAAAALLIWSTGLYLEARRASRTLPLAIAVRRQHWVQACAQGTVLLYWGWHARFVYQFLPFILAQLIFAYAVGSLLSWSRRTSYSLGFGPFPIILSINLFLWFRPEWFYWQLVMIALGILAKELIRWDREGRRAHIFNPSSFPLGIASLVLLVTGASHTTLGSAIANTQPDAPLMYLVIFLVALPGQVLFGVARMTMPAVVTMYVISLVYFNATGTYLFYDAHVPLPVFLGMHLLFTDPSTSPRTELGRILFGMLYALAATGCYLLLGLLEAPTFYDKLLPVPVLNLLVRGIDRLAASRPFAALDPSRLAATLSPTRRNFAYVLVWAGAFGALSAVNGVGDKHPGQYLPFWQNACRTGSARACTYVEALTFIYCNDGSGWACNELGILQHMLGRPATSVFRRACDVGFSPACGNLDRAARGDVPDQRAPPAVADLPILLRGTRPPLRERDPARLRAIACEQGWTGTCPARP